MAAAACLAVAVVGVTVSGTIQLLALGVALLALLLAAGWGRAEDTGRQQVSTA